MIGQHPVLHAFPELQVFGRESLLDMMIHNQENLNRLASPGSIRAIAQVHEEKQTNESCTRAWLWIQKNSDMTAVDFFNYLRKQIEPKIAVEKSPINTLRISRLRQIIAAYPNAKFLHLTRSVKGNAKSLKEFLADKNNATPIGVDPLSAKSLSRNYPASIWLISHRNVLTIKPMIKPENYLRMKGEDLLNNPLKMLENFCEWMEIDSSASSIGAMMRPHESRYAYVGPRIAYGGNDGKFMRQPVLRKKPSTSREIQSHKEQILPEQINLTDTSAFEQNKPLADQEVLKAQDWMKHLYQEIQTMQTRLGY
jgi:hypothetical protein